MKLKSKLFHFTLWWAILGVAIWTGGTVFMMSVINPQWSANPPQTVRHFFTQTGFNHYIWYFFGPPFMLLRSALPQLLALMLGWKSALHRRYLLITFAGTVITILFTVLYIYHINAVLFEQAGGNCTAEEIREMVSKWLWCDRIRFAINLVGFYYLLKTFRLPFTGTE